MTLTDDIKSLLDSRRVRLPYQSYKLQQSDRYGMDVSFDSFDIDEGSMCVTFPFADGNRRDGVGDLLEVAGIDCSRHIENPVVLFDHGKQVLLPIGMAEDPSSGAYTVQIDPISKVAICKAYFYRGSSDKNHALFCEQLFDLVAKRFVRGGSIGYQVIAARELHPDHERGTPKGLHLLKTLMLEASIVVMPANQDTVRKCLGMKCCGKPLSPVLMKSLSPYAPPTNPVVTSGYKKMCNGNCGCQTCNVKEVRKQYRKKSVASYATTSGYQDGETVYARSYLSYVASSGKTEPFAKTGERLKVVDAGGGGMIRVRRSDGTEASFSSAHLRRGKAMAEVGLKDIRLKYRKVKGLRRTMKKSSPGTGIVHVREKDLDAARKAAAEKGLKFVRLGPKNGNERVKLMGADEAIDAVAKAYGRPIRRNGGKVKTKTLSGVKYKDMDMDMENNVDMEEPRGAQLLRRVHEDHSLLMGEYHKYTGGLEPESQKVRAHMEAILGHQEEVLSLTEELFAEIYKDYPGLEGAMTKDDDDMEVEDEDLEETEEVEEDLEEEPVGDEGVGANSGDREEVDPDEAVEAMGVKRLKTKRLKSKKMKGIKARLKKAPVSRKDLETDEDIEEVAEDIEELGEDLEEVAEDDDNPLTKDLTDDEREVLGETGGFLQEIGQAESLDDEKRMKSYHYHKSLERMYTKASYGKKGYYDLEAQYAMDNDTGGSEAPSTPSAPYHATSQQHAMDEGKGLHPSRKMCKTVSGFLGNLSREKAFGQTHREEALVHAKSITDLMSRKDHITNDEELEEDFEVDEEMIEDDGPVEPKSLKTQKVKSSKKVNTKAMKQALASQQKSITELQKQIAQLTQSI